MKTIIIFLLTTAFLPQVLPAQPTVNNNEYYELGDEINMINVNPASIHAGAPGANVTWDFTTLSASGGNSVTTVAANTISAFTANLMITLPTGDIELMSEGSDHSYVNAIIYAASHDTISYNAYNIAKRPFTYMQSYLDTYKIDAASPLITGNGSLLITGDAYGTLKLPGGTYSNVLRIRKYQTETDTISGVDEPTVTTIKYQWFDDTHHAPLFELDSVISLSGDVAKAMYLTSPTGVGYLGAVQASYTGYMLENQLQLTGNFDYGHTYQVTVYNVIGTKIFTGEFSATGNTQRLDIGREVIPGIYIVSLTERNNPTYNQVIKVVKQ